MSLIHIRHAKFLSRVVLTKAIKATKTITPKSEEGKHRSHRSIPTASTPSKHIKPTTIHHQSQLQHTQTPTNQPINQLNNQNVVVNVSANVRSQDHNPDFPPPQHSPKNPHLPWPRQPRLDNLHRNPPPSSHHRKRSLPKLRQRPNPQQPPNIPSPPQTLQIVQTRAASQPELDSRRRSAQRRRKIRPQQLGERVGG